MEETLKLILDKLNNMDSDIKDLKKHVVIMDSDIKDLKKHTVIIENKLDDNSKALFDGYKQVYEKLQEHDKRFDIDLLIRYP